MLKRSLAILALSGTLLAAAAPGWSASTPERLIFDGNVLWNNSAGPWSSGSGPCTLSVATTLTVTQLGTSYFTHNLTTKDPLLTDPYNRTNPRWDPQAASPLRAKYAGDAIVLNAKDLDPWFEQTEYVGAVPYRLANPSEDWTTGWIYTNELGGFGRTDINYAKPLVILTGPQTSSMTLSASNNYLLRGKVNMVKGTTLTIPAGTYLFGEKATTGYLVIDRGAKIFVNGTRANPVVLTSDQDPTIGAMAPGDNGGVVIHGRAIANCANTAAGDSCVSEGGAGYFGGGDDHDNSGSIQYMRIEYSGKEISPDNELNSLTMNAVGDGTTIEYVQCHLGSDDAFEWFGGTARLKHLVVPVWTTTDSTGSSASAARFSSPASSSIRTAATRGPRPTTANSTSRPRSAPIPSSRTSPTSARTRRRRAPAPRTAASTSAAEPPARSSTRSSWASAVRVSTCRIRKPSRIAPKPIPRRFRACSSIRS